jgi:hypothetical protein
VVMDAIEPRDKIILGVRIPIEREPWL